MIVLEKVTKIYQTRKCRVTALADVDLQIEEGEFVVIRGHSGSGKTTLLMTIAAMLRPTSGNVSVAGKNLYGMSMIERTTFRAKTVGFVFQMFHLVPYLTALENVVLAEHLPENGKTKSRAKQLLEQFGLTEQAFRKPSRLSAGEQQRTAIARALMNKPKILLADEPTGNLDPENAIAVQQYIRAFQKDGGTVVIATHKTETMEASDRIIHLRNGVIAD